MIADEYHKSLLQVTLDELAALSADVFREEQPCRLDLVTPETAIPLLIVRRARANRLLILNNGAMDLGRSNGAPTFQRSSWWKDLASHQIYICDPGTIGKNAISINWFQSQPPLWSTAYVAKAIRQISKHLGVTNARNRTYFGSSAGGFAALLQLCADKNAHCIVNNAQFDWTRWFPNEVRTILNLHFNGRTAADVRNSWPYRTNALEFLARTPKPLYIDYHVNMASSYDRDVQLPILERFLAVHPEICGLVCIHRYYSEREGHNPMSISKTINILNSQT